MGSLVQNGPMRNGKEVVLLLRDLFDGNIGH